MFEWKTRTSALLRQRERSAPRLPISRRMSPFSPYRTWLKPYRPEYGKGRICKNFRWKFRAFQKAAGEKWNPWPKDGLRHSYASYHLAKTQYSHFMWVFLRDLFLVIFISGFPRSNSIIPVILTLLPSKGERVVSFAAGESLGIQLNSADQHIDSLWRHFQHRILPGASGTGRDSEAVYLLRGRGLRAHYRDP